MDKLQVMQVFVRIVESSSLRGAAETLNLPPSTVSGVLKNLETVLGVQLIQRTTRRLHLTPDGEVYLEHARRVLEDVADMDAAFTAATRQPRGRLRVGSVMSIGRLILIPQLHAFRTRYPDISLSLSLDDRISDFVKEGLGCAIRTGSLEDSSSLIGRELGRFCWITCASPAFLEKHGIPETLESLADYECVGYSFSRTGRVKEWEFVRNSEPWRHTPSGHIHVNDTEAYVDCGLAGLGIVQAGSYLLEPHIQAGRLVPLLQQHTPASLPVSMVYARSRQLSPVVRAFYEWARDIFAQNPGFRH